MNVIRGIWLLSLIGLSVGCADDADCDPGQELEEGRCVDASGAAGSAGASGSAGRDAGSGGETFGATCSDDETHSECGGAADYCAVQPGQPGYCTATSCVEDPSVCPAEWGCLNLAAFDPSLPSVCTKP
jgi:hypothetical protein